VTGVGAVTIRPATPADEATLGVLGAALMRQHHAADARRFLEVEHPERGYGRFLVSQLGNPEYAVWVAERAGAVVGYVFAGLEPTSWRDLRGPCGFVHDLYVEASARHAGTGEALARAAIAWIHAHARTQVVLMTKTDNASAQRLFARLGFRATMVEMTLDGPPG